MTAIPVEVGELSSALVVAMDRTMQEGHQCDVFAYDGREVTRLESAAHGVRLAVVGRSQTAEGLAMLTRLDPFAYGAGLPAGRSWPYRSGLTLRENLVCWLRVEHGPLRWQEETLPTREPPMLGRDGLVPHVVEFTDWDALDLWCDTHAPPAPGYDYRPYYAGHGTLVLLHQPIGSWQ